MGNFLFSENAWEEYQYWITQDRKTAKKINSLLADIDRNGYIGIGKAEPLKGDLSGYWSRRIDEKNRLVFKISDDTVEIVQCKGHYE